MSVYKTINRINDSDYDYLIKLLALGENGVGKTSLLQQYADEIFLKKTSSTVGVDFKQKRLLRETTDKEGLLGKSQRIHLQLWDTAGHERYRSLCSVFFRDSMGFLLVFDLTNEKSLLNCREWMNVLCENAYCDKPDVILVGNKADQTAERVVTAAMANIVAKELGVPYIETSAATGLNVQKAVHMLLDAVMTRIEDSIYTGQLPCQNNGNRVNIEKEETESKCSC